MRILLLGSNGQFRIELERQLSSVAHVTAFSHESVDITNHKAVRDAVRCVHTNIIVNAAAYTAVDQSEANADFAHAVNADAVANFAQILLRAHSADIQVITIAERPPAALRPLNSQLDTHKLCSHLSFDLPHWKDDFLAVASNIVKELETV